MLRVIRSFIFFVRSIVSRTKNDYRDLFILESNAGRISTTELVNKIFNFIEVYSGKILYPYQTQFAKRVIRSVLENDGVEITALFSRQSGKTETIATTVGGLMIILPQLANMPMFFEDTRLTMFRDGFWIGIFAPNQRQAQITYRRMKTRIQGKESMAVLEDPDFNLEFTTSNGTTVALSNGSYVTAISASDGSSIEGETFMFIICEEAQDISNYKIKKCLAGDTLVLLDSGVEKRLDEVVRDKKDRVVCFDKSMQNLTSKIPTEFYDNGVQDVYVVTLDNGSKIKATYNHQFYTYQQKTKGEKCAFRTVKQIVESMNKDRPLRIGVPDTLEEFASIRFCKVVSVEYAGKEQTYCLKVEGRNFIANGMVSSNSIHPMGAAYNATICKIGTATTFKGDFYDAIKRNVEDYKSGVLRLRNHFEYNYKVVQKYNPKYAKYVEKEKKRLGENSDEFRMSYGLEWIISRGMFVDITELEKTCGDEYLGRVFHDKKATHIAGIDVGGGSAKNRKEADSTVITIVEVDWDNPVVMEKSFSEETAQEEVFLAFNTYIKDWCEIKPEVAEDYEEQYHLIMDYLSNFNLRKVVVDATREASLGQRIRANVKCEVELFTFSTKSKSDLYKLLNTEIKTGRARIPFSKETVETPEHKNFMKQLGELQKGYSGSNLVVSHPDERGAHDDYADSWALAVYGSKQPGSVDETETKDFKSVYNVSNQKTLYKKINTKTARRR